MYFRVFPSQMVRNSPLNRSIGIGYSWRISEGASSSSAQVNFSPMWPPIMLEIFTHVSKPVGTSSCIAEYKVQNLFILWTIFIFQTTWAIAVCNKCTLVHFEILLLLSYHAENPSSVPRCHPNRSWFLSGRHKACLFGVRNYVFKCMHA